MGDVSCWGARGGGWEGGATGENSALLKGRRVAGLPRRIHKPPKNKDGEVPRPHRVCRVSVLRFFFSFHKTLQALSGVEESSI